MKKILRDVLIASALTCGVHGLVSAAAGTGPSTDATPTTVRFDTCSWNHPGVNPFMGDVVAAVDRYRDIPPEVRERLKARMARREYDDLVSIRRDSISGRGGYEYGSTISEMHFGTHQLCHTVTRASWSPTMQERGLVYCESGHCIIVPTVCRNVSRITPKGVGNEVAEGLPPLEALPASEAEPPLAMGELPPIDWFGPTGAGGSDAVPPPVEGGYGGIVAAAPVLFGGGILIAGPDLGPTISTNSTPPAGSDLPGVPPVAAVPEPQTWALMLGGLVALVAARRRSLRSRAAASDTAR